MTGAAYRLDREEAELIDLYRAMTPSDKERTLTYARERPEVARIMKAQAASSGLRVLEGGRSEAASATETKEV